MSAERQAKRLEIVVFHAPQTGGNAPGELVPAEAQSCEGIARMVELAQFRGYPPVKLFPLRSRA